MNILKQVTPIWLKEQLDSKRVTLAQISQFTGIHYPNLHNYLTGKSNMSKPVKVMLYLYFKHEIK